MSGHVNYVMMSAGDVGGGWFHHVFNLGNREAEEGGVGMKGRGEGTSGCDLRDTGILPVKKGEEENINGTGEIYLTLLLRSGLGSA